MPDGGYARPGAGGVTPKNIRREQKVTFLGALKFRKTEKSPKNKKRPDLSRVWCGRVSICGKVGQMGEPLDSDHSKTDNKKAAHNGRLEHRKVTKFCYSCSHKI